MGGGGGDRSGLKIIRALRAPIYRHCLPRPAPPGTSAMHLPPVGLEAPSGLGSWPRLGEGNSKEAPLFRGLCKGRGPTRRRQAMPVPTRDPGQESRAGLLTAARVGQLLPCDGWAGPSCRGISEVKPGSGQQQQKVKAQRRLTCSPGWAEVGARTCAGAQFPCQVLRMFERNPWMSLARAGKDYCCTQGSKKNQPRAPQFAA